MLVSLKEGGGRTPNAPASGNRHIRQRIEVCKGLCSECTQIEEWQRNRRLALAAPLPLRSVADRSNTLSCLFVNLVVSHPPHRDAHVCNGRALHLRLLHLHLLHVCLVHLSVLHLHLLPHWKLLLLHCLSLQLQLLLL